ncbi:MAG: cation:proton antiporter [Chloroflexi bacterium]|nr:cation:proton antiporter [Chloroflexota bacterium]
MSLTLQLILVLAILIVVAKAAGLISTRLKQPAVLGELLAGLLLGPTLINLFHLPFITAPETEEIVFELAELGVILLMFMAGLEVDIEEMLHTGRIALIAGVLGVIAPLLLGAVVSLAFNQSALGSIFIGLILTATSVSISAQTLLELGVLKRREGLALLGAAVVDDVLVILVLSVFLAVTNPDGSNSLVTIIGSMVLFLAIIIPVGLWLLPRLTYRIERLPISEGVMAWAIAVTLLFAWASEAFGQVAAITGAFMAGVFFGRTRLRHEISHGMHTVAYAFFVPLFLVSIGLKVDARTLDLTAAIFMVAITLTAIVSKVAGSGLGARLAGMQWSQALRVGVGMISRGEVGLIVASIGLQQGLISESVFASIVIMVLLTTLVTPLLLRRVFATQTTDTQEKKPSQQSKESTDGNELARVGD